MSEKPIERLNYFSGQRLEAGDLRLEQEYHIQVQRWLMKTLFRPGVAGGFDVKVLVGGKKILLEPGLALDDLGRAIILVAPLELTPQARLLCIRYAEHKERSQQEADCAAKVGGGATVPARWGGGPERILSQPDIFWRADPPMHDTRELVIAELLLKTDCSVERVIAGARRHASPLPVQQVRQISFEGEKDIDENNPKVIHFFIRGGRPNAVTLYLQAKKFSSLHYSEVGQIKPAITGYGPNNAIQTDAPSGIDAHSHDIQHASASPESPAHTHDVLSRIFGPSGPAGHTGPGQAILVAAGGTWLAPPMTVGIGPATSLLAVPGLDFSVSPKGHSHAVTGTTEAAPLSATPASHTHPIRVNVSTTGSGPGTAVRGGLQLAFLADLTISVGKAGSNLVDCTKKILDYVNSNYAGAWNGALSFDGSTGSPLHDCGTGPIRLDLIDGLSFDRDDFTPYEIQLSVQGPGNGGCIQYNLYVD